MACLMCIGVLLSISREANRNENRKTNVKTKTSFPPAMRRGSLFIVAMLYQNEQLRPHDARQAITDYFIRGAAASSKTSSSLNTTPSTFTFTSTT